MANEGNKERRKNGDAEGKVMARGSVYHKEGRAGGMWRQKRGDNKRGGGEVKGACNRGAGRGSVGMEGERIGSGSGRR